MPAAPSDAFDDLTDVYQAMIDWPKRLAHESDFYRRLFRRVGASTVLDVACGTGHHTALFHSWGLTAAGADISPRMIERARTDFGEPAGLSWTVRAFDQPVPGAPPFDVAICVGNSLALAPDEATVEKALRQMLAAVHPGGAAFVHVLNLWRLPDGPCVWQKCQRAALPQGECLIIKGVHRSGGQGFVELVVADPNGSIRRTESVRFLGLEAADLQRMAQQAGATATTVYGGYRDEFYDRDQSVDLLLIAQK